MRIITVSREYGSGGRELGKMLAELLNLKYFDSQIIQTMAQETHMDENYLNTRLENGIANYPYASTRSFSRVSQVSGSAMLIAKQHKVIKELAAEDCLIVGRGADAVLNDLKPFKIFVYADMPSKIARCKQRSSDGEIKTDKEAERKINRIDGARKSVHDLYSGFNWGDKIGYNLCVNTTGVNIKEIAPLVAAYAEKYFKNV